MKKIVKILASMKFAIIILIALMLVSIIGSLIPQNQAPEFYRATYENFGDLILRLNLDQLYTSTWYLLLAVFLSLSIFFCIVVKLKPLIKIFRTRNFKQGLTYMGLWLLHLGLILLILFFALGNATAYQNRVYNVCGTLSSVPETDISIEILDFDLVLSDQGHIDQYKSQVKFYDQEKNLLDQGEISVNHPMTIKGYQFSQASYGYYVEATVFKDGEKLGQAALLENEYISIEDGRLTLRLNRFYPDVKEKDGDLINNSKLIKNPMLEYTAYLGTMAVKTDLVSAESKVQVGSYEIEFTNPAYYPILDIRKDSFELLTGLGALCFMLGSFMVFYQPRKKEEKK
ncbi:MAG: cytochrome c biogenesis protein ResB [Bacillota bacterium]|nr:cytochrome c biogenesis protein ResB [Bacillota bacterium]